MICKKCEKKALALTADGLCIKCNAEKQEDVTQPEPKKQRYAKRRKTGTRQDIKRRRNALAGHMKHLGRNKTTMELCQFLKRNGFKATPPSTANDIKSLGFKSVGRVGYRPEWRKVTKK